MDDALTMQEWLNYIACETARMSQRQPDGVEFQVRSRIELNFLWL